MTTPMNFAPHISPTKDAAAAAAAGHILERLEAARQASGRATLAVSGGSTPRLMFQVMATAGFDWADVHIFWVDERCVPPDAADSNYGMTKEALFDSIAIAPDNIHRIQGEREPAEASTLYRAEIEKVFELADKPSGTMPRFDVVHLGMGPDRHTASLFPGEELINDRRGLTAAVYAASQDSWRVTLLPGVLLAAADTVFLVTGDDKAAALREVINGPYDPQQRPVQLIARDANPVHWFLDEAARASSSLPTTETASPTTA